MGSHKPPYTHCKNCHSELDFWGKTTTREHNHHRAGYCGKRCKAVSGLCGEMCCLDRATEGVFCWRHKLAESIRQTQRQVRKANSWLEKNGYTLESLPAELPFDTGWPDDPQLCREVKTRNIESHRKGVQGEGIVFPDWPAYVQHMIVAYKDIPRFKPQTSEAPPISESREPAKFKVEPIFIPPMDRSAELNFTTVI
jgi:hypothetical protein